jgi:predicted small lipoprotein YifL
VHFGGYTLHCPVSLVIDHYVEDVLVLRAIARVTAFMLLAAVLSPIAACGKKGPLYLPAATPLTDAASKTADPPDQERR